MHERQARHRSALQSMHAWFTPGSADLPGQGINVTPHPPQSGVEGAGGAHSIRTLLLVKAKS